MTVLSVIFGIAAFVAVAAYELPDHAAPPYVTVEQSVDVQANAGLVAVTVVSVHDGDTFSCDIAGYPPIIGHHIGIRINGIDTPEMKDKRPTVRELARKAKEFSEKRLMAAGMVELRNMQRDKYFRIVADVYVDGVDLGRELIDAGLAKPYDGGRKPQW